MGSAENFCCRKGAWIQAYRVCNGGIVLLYYSKGEIKFPPHLEHLHNINLLVVPKGIAQVLVHGWAADLFKRSPGTSFLLHPLLLLEPQGKRTGSKCLLSWQLLPLERQTRGRTGLR